MKALIVGIDSQIGHAYAQSLQHGGADVYGTSRRRIENDRVVHLDLADLGKLDDLPSCDVAFLCAAETKISACREDPASTMRINVTAPVTLARHLVARGCFVIFLSSNAVFDGSAPCCQSDAPTCPVTPYGKQKADAEKQILELGSHSAVLRLTKVLTPTLSLFTKWIEMLKSRQGIMPFHDMVFAPISLDLVTEALTRIAEQRAGGVFQASASRDVSYAEAARYIAYRLGSDPALVQPISSADVDISPTDVPRHTMLDASRLNALLGRPSPDPFAVIDMVFQLKPVRITAV